MLPSIKKDLKSQFYWGRFEVNLKTMARKFWILCLFFVPFCIFANGFVFLARCRWSNTKCFAANFMFKLKGNSFALLKFNKLKIYSQHKNANFVIRNSSMFFWFPRNWRNIIEITFNEVFLRFTLSHKFSLPIRRVKLEYQKCIKESRRWNSIKISEQKPFPSES